MPVQGLEIGGFLLIKNKMAERRMISLEVVDTDAFLDMPQSSQLLYFHLSIRADDDGFVSNPRKIARTLGVGVDDMKVLIGKKFVIAFEDGVCVIKHWRINNFIRKDIYKETKYLNLKQTLFIRPNGAYTLNDDGNAIPIPKGHFQLDSVNEALTERQLRLEKGSIGKDRLESGKEEKLAPKEIALRFFSEEDNQEQESVISMLLEGGMSEQVARAEIKKFVMYWTELNSTGKKQRWEMEKTFEVKRRLTTWFAKVSQFKGFDKDKNKTKFAFT
jgi:hypothetical protein